LLDAANGGVANGTGIIQWPYNLGDNQVWRFQHLGVGKYKITGSASGRVLDVAGGAVSNGSKVHLWSYFGGANQVWRVTPVDNRYFRLCPTHGPGSCLDVKDVSKTKGAEVHLWQCLKDRNQQWALLPR
jgi:glucosylceramidase